MPAEPVSDLVAAPRLSIVVSTFNRRRSLGRMLSALEAEVARGIPFEVVVAVDGSSDGTLDMLRGLRPPYPLRIVSGPRRGPAAGRNRASEAARAEILLFLDDDVLPTPDLLTSHLVFHERDPLAAVIGPMLPAPGLEPWLEWEASTLDRQYRAMERGDWGPTPRQFYTANASVRRDLVLGVGGFDESFRRAEDVELGYRLQDRGVRFYFVSTAAVTHQPDRTFDGWLAVAREYARFDVIMERDRGRRHVQLAYREWPTRHPLNRLVTQACVGHGTRSRLAERAGRLLLSYPGPGRRRLRALVCGILWNIRYWEGMAELTGLGGAVWRGLRDPAEIAAALPADA